MRKVIFEDLYTYANKYYKDVARRSSKPITKTLADIAKGSPEVYNKPGDSTFLPYPGDAIIEKLGLCYVDITDAAELITLLLQNPSVEYDTKTKKMMYKKLKKIKDLLQSVSDDLDKESTIKKSV